MFTPSSNYRIEGTVAGVHVHITITVNADNADASKLLNAYRPENRPLTAAPHNVQALLVTAVNQVLGDLQIAEEAPGLQQAVNGPQAGPTQGTTPAPTSVPSKVISFQDFRDRAAAPAPVESAGPETTFDDEGTPI